MNQAILRLEDLIGDHGNNGSVFFNDGAGGIAGDGNFTYDGSNLNVNGRISAANFTGIGDGLSGVPVSGIGDGSGDIGQWNNNVGFIEDAPSDSQLYARLNAAWSPFSPGISQGTLTVAADYVGWDGSQLTPGSWGTVGLSLFNNDVPFMSNFNTSDGIGGTSVYGQGDTITFLAGTNMTVTDDGVGNITFDASGSGSLAIGNAVGGGNPNDILFIDDSGNLAQDDRFQWLATSATLQVFGSGNFNNGNADPAPPPADQTAQLNFGYTDGNYRHQIRTIHSSGSKTSNVMAFWLWNPDLDGPTDNPSTNVMNLAADGTVQIPYVANSNFVYGDGSGILQTGFWADVGLSELNNDDGFIAGGPGGVVNSVQINNGIGGLGGDANLLYDGNALTFTQNSGFAKIFTVSTGPIINIGTDQNFQVEPGTTLGSGVALASVDDAVAVNLPLEFRASEYFLNLGPIYAAVMADQASIGNDNNNYVYWNSANQLSVADLSTVNLSQFNNDENFVSFTDPNIDAIVGWDDTDGSIQYFNIGSGLLYDHSTHTLSSTGGNPFDQSLNTADSPSFISESLNNGNDPSTEPTKTQLFFGYYADSQYRHAIKTEHDSGVLSNNQIQFYVWDTSLLPSDEPTANPLSISADGSIIFPYYVSQDFLGTDASGIVTGGAWSSVNLSQFNNDLTPTGWQLTGNAGTTPGTNYLGTSDATDVVFAQTGTEAVRIQAGTGFVGINKQNPAAPIDLGSSFVNIPGVYLYDDGTYVDGMGYYTGSSPGNELRFFTDESTANTKFTWGHQDNIGTFTQTMQLDYASNLSLPSLASAGGQYITGDTNGTLGLYDFSAVPLSSLNNDVPFMSSFNTTAGGGTSTYGQGGTINFVDGTNITMVDDGTGNITVNAAGGGASFGTVGTVQLSDGAGGFTGDNNVWYDGQYTHWQNGAGIKLDAVGVCDYLYANASNIISAGTWSAVNLSQFNNDLPAPPIAGSFSGLGTATTTFTVTIGSTQANNTYKVNVTPTSALSAAIFYVNNKTTTTFDVVYLAGLTGTVLFDWSLFT